jgi:hypothetical protein
MFITLFTKALHLYHSWARSIESMSRPTSLSTFYLSLGLPSGLLPSGFLTKTLRTFSTLHMCYIPCHISLLDLITRMMLGSEYRALRSSLCSLLYSPVTSSLLGLTILFSTLLSKNLILRFSLSVTDQVSHPCKTIGKIIFQYILIRSRPRREYNTEWGLN